MTRSGLRSQVLKGGVYLSVRQTLGITINVAGVLLLMRIIGPGDWGVYAAALGYFYILQLITQLGIPVYLVRAEDPEDRAVLNQAATVLLLLAAAGAVVGGLLLPLYEQATRLDLRGPGYALLLGLPAANLAAVPLSHLERTLDFKRIAWLELSGQAMFFVVAIAAAALGRGMWAPVLGWWAQQSVLTLFGLALARYAPRLAWNRSAIRDMLTYGTGYSASVWAYQLRRIVNPLVVGRYLGAEAVGIVSLCTQIVTHLGFASVATWRLAMAALSRVQSERDRLLKAINEGMHLQVLAVSPFLLGFAWTAPWLMPVLLGERWRAVGVIFPYIATIFLINSVFTMHSSAMYVLRNNLSVGVSHAVQFVALLATAVLLVPRFGLDGYGLAEVSMIVGYVVLHGATVRVIGKPTYSHSLPLAVAASVAMFTHALGALPLLLLAGTLIVMRPWRDVQNIVAELRGAMSGT